MSNIAIFASGSGTNAENIIRYFCNHPLIRVTLVATNNPNAYVIGRAKMLAVPVVVFSLEELRNGVLLNLLKLNSIDLIVLAGFIKLVPEQVINAFPGRIVNIHPALLPAYGGKGMYGNKVHEAVLANGERESGITIHYVNNRYDEGDIIFQAKCEVNPSDTPDTLAQKVHALEYQHYPRVIESLLTSPI
ncbi:MAG TPA: phosphoribosylglycinamide formyltransferase [Tenuifilaceae bacterium]|nr:phosphoribosylglycinamide formyltransferase [Tenuifilaceae bacterium]HQQ30167.1 phosphoribosylglycinamide formyltransferase [Tenuifilaceae bacterium]